jgi:ribosomal protein S18 acetylase RimI-like enzyme
MADFRFTNEHSVSHEGALDVLSRPRLWIPGDDYPDYEEWLEKAEAQLIEGDKRAMVAYSDQRAIGAIVYQRHRSIPGTIEIKNISVNPEKQGRYVGSFLLRNVEIEAGGNDYPDSRNIVVDTKATNLGMISFLSTHGYSVVVFEDLYRRGTGEDALLSKSLAA